MANISDYKQVPLSTILGDLAPYKYNPSKIVDVTLDRLSDMLDDKVDIVDPSNPFVYLLETSCLNTAFAIQEYALQTKKLYPRLANNEEDLYLHMSDFDYLGRFSEPSRARVSFNILYASFKSNAVQDLSTGDYTFKLPRHYKITVGKQVFTLLYPIVIRETAAGIIDIRYDNTSTSDLQSLSTDFVEYFLVNQFNNEKYIVFTIDMLEVDIEPVEVAVEKSKLFKSTINYDLNRSFYYLEAYYYNNGLWNKMIVTHTNEVYDVNTPTMIVKVKQDSHAIDYYIPPVYVNNDRVGSKIKILVYTTNGYIDINFSDYQLSDFAFEYNPVFKDLDLDQHTTPLELISKVVMITDRVVGGRGAMAFETLKDNVITNSIGDRKTPITDKQLEFLAEQSNFTLIKAVDTLTHRLYDLQVSVPRALTRYPITKVNLDIMEYASTLDEMVYAGCVKQISPYKYTIPKGTLFKSTSGKLELLTQAQKTNLEALEGIELVNDLNTNSYYSTFFHYVLDLSDKVTDLRVYNLDTPKLLNINFRYYNTTTQIGANTSGFTISKIDTGYMLEVKTKVTPYSTELNFTNLNPYLVYETQYGSKFYIAGTLLTIVDGAPIFHFYLNSDFDIDKDTNLSITNFKDVNGSDAYVYVNLVCDLQLLYLSDQLVDGYVSEAASAIVNDSYLAGNYYLVTQEELHLEIGQELRYLKRNTHNATSTVEYEKHSVDVPMRYTQNVYDDSDVIIHHISDLVYDTNNEVVMQYKAGDIKLDVLGHPIPTSDLNITRFFNLLLVDYRAARANNTLIKDYLNYIRDYLVEIITVNTTTIYQQLLENTQAYVTVPKNLNYIQVRKDSTLVQQVKAQQSFVLNVHVSSGVYSDVLIKDNINYTLISTIENYLVSKSKLSKSELTAILYTALSEFVQSISFVKFTDRDAEYLEVLDQSASFTFNKVFFTDSDGTYSLKEDITINYIKAVE